MAESTRETAAGDAARARGYERPLVAALVVWGVLFWALAALRFRGDGPHVGEWRGLLLLFLLVWVATAVLWLRWFAAVYRVARATGVTRHDGVMVVIAWLIPVVTLVVPKRMVNDVWEAGGDGTSAPPVVQAWWVLWCAAGLINGFGWLFRGRDTSDPYGSFPVDWGVLAVAVPFAVATVRALTRRVGRIEQQLLVAAAREEEAAFRASRADRARR